MFSRSRYSKISHLRPCEIKTTSLLRPVFASLCQYLPDDIIFNIKTTIFCSLKDGLNRGISLYYQISLVKSSCFFLLPKQYQKL